MHPPTIQNHRFEKTSLKQTRLFKAPESHLLSLGSLRRAPFFPFAKHKGDGAAKNA